MLNRRYDSALIRALLLTTALIGAAPAHAASQTEQPILLNANQLIYDDKARTVTADGDVTFTQNGQVVKADRMTYDRASDVVTADGNVRIWQPDGQIVTATHAELSRDLRQAFIRQTTLLMTDNSRFIAQEGERTEGRYVRLNRALYTACDLCKDDPRKPPLWQVRAQRIVHDTEKQNVYYRNATLELGGVPVFYTPYMSHPDPNIKRRSGFLAPVIGSRNNLGFVTRTYYYLDVAPSMDATIETTYSAKRGALIGGQWRHKTDHGSYTINASANFDDIPNNNTALPPERDQLRGHFFLDAEHDFTPNWRGTLSIKRTTDDTYLDLWNYSSADVLPSKGTLEYFTPRSYGQLSLQSYQDLRTGITTAEPQVMVTGWQTQSAPHSLMGGRWFLGLENRSVARSRGTDSNRTALALGWQRKDVMPAGIMVTTEANARADGFIANNLNNDDPTAFRPFIQGQITASLPLVKVGRTGQQFIEPIAQLSIAPRQSRNDDDIANEDSLSLEFDTTNLFSSNRYAGYDRLDGGQRLAYGIRAGWTGNSGASIGTTIGQSYDFADHPNYTTGSGLDTQNSDIVGNITASLPEMADIAYSFRLSQENMDPREHDLRATIGPDWLQGSVSYLYINQTDATTLTETLREELGLGAQYKLSDLWSLAAYHRRDLQRSDGALESGASLTYQDECLTFSLIGQRDHVARSGLSSGDSVFFRLVFKNLGEFQSPSFNPDIFSSSKSE